VAIALLRGPLSGTEGYAAMWLVCSLVILASIPLLRRVRDAEDAGDEAPEPSLA
jgi:hypothetical protein